MVCPCIIYKQVYLLEEGTKNPQLLNDKAIFQESDLGEICWPVPEFSPAESTATFDLPADWNDALYIDESVQLMEVLRLGDVQVYETDSWRDLVDQVRYFFKIY